MTESSTLSEYGKVYTDLPEVVPNCQVSLRGCGLPHQCAHWFAMTCRRQRRVSGCKDVGCSDMLKAVACQRVQGRVWRVRCAEPCHASVVAEVFGAMTPLPTVIARSEATRQSASPAIAHDREQYFERIRESVYGFARSGAKLSSFTAGMRIATPVCALVRNDMQKAEACQRVQGRGVQ